MQGYLEEAAVRFARTIDWVREALDERGTMGAASVLEVGSNPYFLTILLAETFPSVRHTSINHFGDDALVGTMQSQDVVDPRGRLARALYLYADVERHPLDALGSFDVCLFCEVIEHLVADPAWALFNIARRLRPGGDLILTTPNPARLENVVRLALHSGSPGDPISGYGIHGRHNREYTRAELVDLLSESRLTVLRSRTIDVSPSVWSKAAEAAGYGQYVMIHARRESPARIHRPPWLYRSFAPAELRSERSLASR